MESQTEQDCGGIAVITLDSHRLLSMRHVLVCQESGHEAGFLRVFAGLEDRLLELVFLHVTDGLADLLKAREDIAQEVDMVIEGLEDVTLLRRRGKQYDSLCGLVHRRELCRRVVFVYRTAAKG